MNHATAPPEAQLIRLAREARGMSPEDAAPRSGVVKASRWRQIEKGFANRGGEQVPTRANDATLARMAHVVGVRPHQLVEVGKSRAAQILAEIIRQEAAEAEQPAVPARPEVVTAYTPAGNRVLIPVPPGLSEEGRAKLIKWGIRMGQILLEEESEGDDPTL